MEYFRVRLRPGCERCGGLGLPLKATQLVRIHDRSICFSQARLLAKNAYNARIAHPGLQAVSLASECPPQTWTQGVQRERHILCSVTFAVSIQDVAALPLPVLIETQLSREKKGIRVARPRQLARPFRISSRDSPWLNLRSPRPPRSTRSCILRCFTTPNFPEHPVWSYPQLASTPRRWPVRWC